MKHITSVSLLEEDYETYKKLKQKGLFKNFTNFVTLSIRNYKEPEETKSI